jgi:myo-inositol-1(or 4)-monophosphatase
VEDGLPVVGGICNPATNEIFLGSLDLGITYNGKLAQASQRTSLEEAVVLASRSESKRGEWTRFANAPFKVQEIGSVAYKLAKVSAGLADATFTLTPKNEWDIAGGAALVLSAGGFVLTLDRQALRCNNRSPLLSGLLAGGPNLRDPLLALLGDCIPKLEPSR